MKVKIYLMVLAFLITSEAFSEVENKAMPLQKVEALEKSISEEVKKRNPSKKELQAIYNLAARELYYLGYLKKAEEYYEKSFVVEIDVNKSEALINFMSIAFTEKDMTKLKKQRERADKYYKANTKYKNTEIEMYLSSIDDVLQNKITKDRVSFFSEYIRSGSFEKVLKEKNYEEELMKYNVERLVEADLASVVDYDLLNVLSRKKNVQKLFCYDQFKQYPDAFAPAIIVCGMLSDYLAGKELREESFTRLEKYFQEIDGDKRYILPYLRELK